MFYIVALHIYLILYRKRGNVFWWIVHSMSFSNGCLGFNYFLDRSGMSLGAPQTTPQKGDSNINCHDSQEQVWRQKHCRFQLWRQRQPCGGQAIWIVPHPMTQHRRLLRMDIQIHLDIWEEGRFHASQRKHRRSKSHQDCNLVSASVDEGNASPTA